MEDQIGLANPWSWSKSLEECWKESQLFQLKLSIWSTGQSLSKLFSSTSMSPVLRKNDAKKTANYKWETENTLEKENASNMSGSDNFLDLNREWFLHFHVSDHVQQDIIGKHLASVIYFQLKAKLWESRAHLWSCARVKLKLVIKMVCLDVLFQKLCTSRSLPASVAWVYAGVWHNLNCHCCQIQSHLRENISNEPNEQSDHSISWCASEEHLGYVPIASLNIRHRQGEVSTVVAPLVLYPITGLVCIWKKPRYTVMSKRKGG